MMDPHNPAETVSVVDENGNETLHDILFTFHSDEYQKDYILLVPQGIEEDEAVDVQAFIFDPTADTDSAEGGLEEIEDDKEWAMVEEVLDAFLDDDSNFQ